MSTNLPEVWLRGPVDHIPSLLQPAAHAVMQALEEVKAIMTDFPQELLWEKPAGVASVAFHLQHMAGVLDRLSTYARKEMLSPEQMNWLQGEGKETTITVETLLANLEQNVQLYLQQLTNTNEATLTEPRTIGRKALPTTHLGLLFHAAEHTQRHLGQLLVTARIVKANRQ
ncbi:MAG TPA: DinB family protein [Flavisolibacter sp.]|nr:DinB family protein [Flavisolibacter sp.]